MQQPEGTEQLEELNNILSILQKLSSANFSAELTAAPKQIREIISWIFFIPNDKLPLQISILQQLIDYQNDQPNYTQIKDSIKSLNLNHLDLIESRLKSTPVALFQQYNSELKARVSIVYRNNSAISTYITSSQSSPPTTPTNATTPTIATYTLPTPGPFPQLFPLSTNARPTYLPESSFLPSPENNNIAPTSPAVNIFRYANDVTSLNNSAATTLVDSDHNYMNTSDGEEDYPSSPTRYITDPKRNNNMEAPSNNNSYDQHDGYSTPSPVANPINVSPVYSPAVPSGGLNGSGYISGYSNNTPMQLNTSGHIKFSHFVDAVHKFCSDTEKFSGDIKLNGFKWTEHKDSQGNTITAILVSGPEADKSWGKGDGESFAEFESYGFFYDIIDPIKRLRVYWLEIGNANEISNLRRSGSIPQPKSTLRKLNSKEVNEMWLNQILKDLDDKELMREVLIKLMNSDDLRQEDAKMFSGSRRIKLRNFIEYQKRSAPQTPNILACWYNISIILESYTINGEITLNDFIRFVHQFGSWSSLLPTIEALFDSNTGVSDAYFGKISVKDVWSTLRNRSPGTYLLRDPTSDGNILTASFITAKGQLEHAKIWRSSTNLYFIPEEKNSKVKKFSSVSECIKAFPEFKESVRTTKQWLPVMLTAPRLQAAPSMAHSTDSMRSLGSSAASLLNFDSPRITGAAMADHAYSVDPVNITVSAGVLRNPDPLLDFIKDALGSEGLKDTAMVNDIVPSLLAQYHEHAGLPKPTSTDIADMTNKIRNLAMTSPRVEENRSVSIPTLNLSFGSVQDVSLVSPHGNVTSNVQPKSGKKVDRKIVIDGYYESDDM